jgi:UDP-4-amino-4,6-dideoxy-N-acetyl-beta-L-altrosamine transaminase
MTVPYGRQDITQDDIDAVTEVLRSDFLTQGPAVPAFEAAVAARVGASHAVAVSNATAALHVACLALGLGKGDVLWTVPNTFVASANCARYCGADVDFVDIDPVTWNMSVPRLREKLEIARTSGRLPKIVVPVHFAGQPTDQQAIWKLSGEYGFRVIEDASHSIGARRCDERVGSCRWSDVTVFSFHPVKIVTTGEGGMIVTNDAALAARMAMLRSHGITRDRARFLGESAGPWYYEQQLLGFNYRMTDIQAALGLSQLTRIDEYIGRRNELARRYDVALKGLPLTLPAVEVGNTSAFHLYVVRVKLAETARSHREIVDALHQRGILVNLHYMPVHLQPYYRALGFAPGQFPKAEAHGQEAITLPLFPAMTDAMHDEVVQALQAIL